MATLFWIKYAMLKAGKHTIDHDLGKDEECEMNTSETPLIRVLIVSDSHLIRSGLRRILESRPIFRILEDLTIDKAGIFSTTGQGPDLVLIELEPDARDALELIARLKELKRDCPVLVLCDLTAHELARKALSLGAAGVVLKMQPPAVLIAAIEELCPRDGYKSVQRSLAAKGRRIHVRRVSNTSPNTEHMRKIDRLTAREREIIRLVGHGMKNKEIASRLAISDITVRHHLTSIFSKLEIEDRQKLLILAHRSGLADFALNNESA